jgi:hypothetical protein
MKSAAGIQSNDFSKFKRKFQATTCCDKIIKNVYFVNSWITYKIGFEKNRTSIICSIIDMLTSIGVLVIMAWKPAISINIGRERNGLREFVNVMGSIGDLSRNSQWRSKRS